MPLISSQHFPVWVASQMSEQVRACDLASARPVHLSVRISAAVSISMNQCSSFEEPCPSNVGISCSMVMVRFDSLCVACKVSIHLHGFVHRFLIRLGAECVWSIIVRCCSLSVSCISSAIGVDWGVVDFKLANWSLSCWNCSHNSPKGQQVSVSS